MNKIKTLLLLGGTGFVGRAIAEEYLKNGWHIVIPTRNIKIDDVKKKLIHHGFNKCSLEKYIKDNIVLFAVGVDLADKRWIRVGSWLKLFHNLNIPTPSILSVINLAGETSKSSNDILKSNIEVLNSIFILVRYLKDKNKEVIFCNMGSTVEKKQCKNLSPYEKAKKIARQEIEKSNLCDYHFVVNYVKGKGEQKMKLVAPYLWNKLKLSHKWFFGFKVSIIDVDDLAGVIYHILEVVKYFPLKRKLVEVNVTNGELIFGEIIKNLLPENKRVVPKMIIPVWLEDYFLQFYSFMAPRIKPNDQFVRRLASYARRGLLSHPEQEKLKVFKTANEIKRLAQDTINYLVLETKPNLIIVDKHNLVIYILVEKNEEELKKVVQKAIVFSD